jgi:polar amino acid transport system substrate-binding protein
MASQPKRLFGLAVLAVTISLPGPLPGQAAQTSTNRLTVGMIEEAPFAMKNSHGQWEGIAIDLWRTIATSLELNYDFKEIRTAGLRAELERNGIHVVMGDVAITPEGEKVMDYTQAFYAADLAIGTPRLPPLSASRALLEAFFSWQFLRIILVTALVLLVIGLCIYYLERQHNPDAFGGKKSAGLLYGVYWSAAVMSGVGDQAPRTTYGRILALAWIFIGIFATSSFTAAVTKVMAIQPLSAKIRSERDLPHCRVAVVQGTYESLLRDMGARQTVVSSPAEALQAVVNGQADACVLSEPLLKYIAGRDFKDKLTVIPMSRRKRFYAFGLPPNSPLREALNVAVLEVISGPSFDDILQRYLDH